VTEQDARQYGLGRGKVFPAADARSLLNPLRRLVQSPRRTVAAMAIGPADRVLEVGPGPGYFSPSLAAAASEGVVVLADLQLEMVAMASRRMGASAAVGYLQGDAMALPLGSGAFDVVVVATMLGEVPDRRAFLEEVRRVLRVGGHLTVCETRRDSDFLRIDELRELVVRHGFRFAGRRGPRWQYVARFERSGA
jgi:ubiquinone/menaquinone biosynthesis C-methylase UbiE